MPPVALAVVPLLATAAIPGALGIVASISLGIGLNALSAALFKPKVPKPEDGTVNTAQAIPTRIRGYGRARLGGSYMFRESGPGEGNNEGTAYQLLALHSGRIDAVERHWLHDEVVTIDGAGQVVDPSHFDDEVHIRYRMGETPETSYSQIVDNFPDLWTLDHRGDGIASALVTAKSVSAKNHQSRYPSGLPQYNGLLRMSRVWDPRDPEQNPGDPSTWKWSDNWALCIMDYLTHPDGLNLDMQTYVMPAIDEFIAAANVCDEAVPLKNGGTEPRWRLNKFYQLDNDPADVLASFLLQGDGYLYLRTDGAIGIKAGRFETPTVTIPARHILDYTVPQNRVREDTINQILARYTSPDHDWTEVDAQEWNDEASITKLGRPYNTDLDLTGCISHGQTRRLMKRAIGKARARRGTVVTNAYGILAKGQRYINIEFGELNLGTITAEVESLRVSLESCRVSIDWVEADPAIDEWDPATEEGEAPPVPQKNYENIDGRGPPVPQSFVASGEAIVVSGGLRAVRLRISFDNPGQDGMQYFVQYRKMNTAVSPAEPGPWVTEEVVDVNPDVSVIEHVTAVVDDNATYEVRAQSKNGGGAVSAFTALQVVHTAADNVAPGPASGFQAAGGNFAFLDWTMSNSPNVRLARIYRAPTGQPLGAAVPVGGPRYGSPNQDMSYTDNPADGSWDYWVVLESGSGIQSTPVGPETALVATGP